MYLRSPNIYIEILCFVSILSVLLYQILCVGNRKKKDITDISIRSAIIDPDYWRKRADFDFEESNFLMIVVSSPSVLFSFFMLNNYLSGDVRYSFVTIINFLMVLSMIVYEYRKRIKY